MSNETSKRPWRLHKVVLPQHTDHGGVMWHGSYLGWLEEARVDALSQVGISYENLTKRGFELPVIHLEMNYRSSLSHGDSVLIESKLMPRKGLRLQWFSSFVKEEESNSVEAKIELILVAVENSSRKIVRAIPEDISKAFLELEEGPSS